MIVKIASSVKLRIERFRLLYCGEDDDIVAFADINPSAPVHILIIPRRHISYLNDLTEADAALIGKINWVAAQLAKEKGIAKSGWRLIANCGADAGQEVFHNPLSSAGRRTPRPLIEKIDEVICH